LTALGFRNVPVTVAGDKAVPGFDRQGLTDLFKLSDGIEKKLAGPWLFETLDKMLAGVIHATRQVPSEQMMWTTPDRDRPFKVFCYHILVDPIHVLDAIGNGKYDGNFKLTYAEKAEPFGSMEEVARFGEECRARLHQAAQELSPADLSRTIDGYAGKTDGHELFYLVMSHTAHHLRQLYEMLRMIGVEPAERLGDKDFEGISMPKDLW
jgi:hypothetical protein